MSFLRPGKKGCASGCFVKILFLICLLIVIIMGIDSNVRLVTEEFPISYADLPPAFDGFRITQLSDIHNKKFGGSNDKLIEEVKKTKPNIIAVTGDLIDGNGQLESMISLMKSLCDIAPTYYVSGNNEWATDEYKELFAGLEAAGVIMLDNAYDVVTVGDASITLVGICDPNGPADMKTRQEMFESLPDAAKENFIITLVHRNENFEEYALLGADLVLCGHSHGGTIRLPVLGGLFDHSGILPKYENGIFDISENSDGSAYAFVSRGIGNAHHFPRFMNNPQIAVVILRVEV